MMLLLLLLVTAAPARPASAPPLPTAIYLTVKTAAGETRAAALPGRSPSPGAGPAKAAAGEKPEIRWSVRNLDRKKPTRDLVVHFLITREDTAPAPRGPREGSLADQVLGTDLAPREATTGRYELPLHEPGAYVVELELLDPRGAPLQSCRVRLAVE